MTGTVQAADEVVQDRFVRLLERPPADPSRPLRPWLVAVTLNLARDRLRRRKRQACVGPWLPAPVPDARLADEALALRRTASRAFLVVAEAPTPNPRAVFLAREVLDWSAAETAEALGTTPGALDVAPHRAREAIGELPDAPSVLDDAVVAGFFALVQVGLPGAARRLRAPNVVVVDDGGGRVNAARLPVVGPAEVMTLFRRLARAQGPGRWTASRANGLLVLVGTWPPHPRLRLPSRFVLLAEARGGRITRFWTRRLPKKLGAG